MDEAQCSYEDVDAVAVTTKPGLVIALKEGIRMALRLSRFVVFLVYDVVVVYVVIVLENTKRT